MIVLRSLFIAAAVLAGARPAAGEEIVRLDQVERQALANEDLRVEVGAAIAAAQAGLDQARATHRPRAGLTIDGSLAPGGQLVEVSSTTGSRYLVQGSRTLGQAGALVPLPRYGAVLSVQQTLVDFGRGGREQGSAEHRLQSAHLEGQRLRQEVLGTARRAYLAWLVAFEQHRLVAERVSRSEADLRKVEARIREGARPPAERTAARAALVATQIEEARSSSELDRRRLALQSLTRAPLSPGAAPDRSLLDRPRPGTAMPSDLHALALAQEAAAHDDVSEALRLRSAPVVSVGGELGVRGQTDLLFPAYRVLLSISVSLWDGGVAHSQAVAATAEAQRLRAQAASSRRNAVEERGAASSDWAHADHRVALAEELVSLSRELLAQAEERYGLGATDLTALDQASARVLDADLQALDAKGARAEAVLRMLGDGLAP